MAEPVFHIASASDWAAGDVLYRPVCLLREGFVHCSTAEQVMLVANSKYVGRSDLLVLAVDPDLLYAELRYEGQNEEERYPHIYGPIERAAVIAAEQLRVADDGSFVRPRLLEEHMSAHLRA